MASAEYPLYPASVLLPVLAAFTIPLGIPPLVWHFSQRNIAALSLITWVILLNLANVINPILWGRDNISTWYMGHGLCDIEVYLFVGGYVALPGALVCIMRRLAKVMDTDRMVVIPSRADRRREVLQDLLWCFGFPITMMLVYYIIQPVRYFLWGISGCAPAFDPSWPSLALNFIWPPIISVISLYYTILLVYRLYRYRAQFSRLVSAKNTTKSRFLRLLIMAFLFVIGVLPLQFWFLAHNISQVFSMPYSWSRVHGADWNTVIAIPSNGAVQPDHWAQVAYGYVLFFTFGTGADASRLYRTMVVGMGLKKVFPRLFEERVRQTSTGQSGSGTGKESWLSLSKKFSRKGKQMESVTDTMRSCSSCPTSPTHTIYPPRPTNPPRRPSIFHRLFILSKPRPDILPVYASGKPPVDSAPKSVSTQSSPTSPTFNPEARSVHTRAWATDSSRLGVLPDDNDDMGVRIKKEVRQSAKHIEGDELV